MFTRPYQSLLVKGPWKRVLEENDQKAAKEFIAAMRPSEHFVYNATIIGYPRMNVFINGKVSRHLVRILNDLKLLAVFGRHSNFIHK